MGLCCIYFFVRAALEFVNANDGGFFLIIALGFALVSVMLKLADK